MIHNNDVSSVHVLLSLISSHRVRVGRHMYDGSSSRPFQHTVGCEHWVKIREILRTRDVYSQAGLI